LGLISYFDIVLRLQNLQAISKTIGIYYLTVMRETELADEQWQRLKPLLPPPKRHGRPRADDRKTLNGILYVLRTGCRWTDVPREYGSPTTCWRRLRAWEEDGTWERVWRGLLALLDEQNKLEWTIAFLDGSFVPAKKGEPV
jgi:transposase